MLMLNDLVGVFFVCRAFKVRKSQGFDLQSGAVARKHGGGWGCDPEVPQAVDNEKISFLIARQLRPLLKVLLALTTIIVRSAPLCFPSLTEAITTSKVRSRKHLPKHMTDVCFDVD